MDRAGFRLRDVPFSCPEFDEPAHQSERVRRGVRRGSGSVNVTMVTPGADDEMVITDLAYGAIRADIARPGDAVARRR